jgi:hypothetical protein
MSQVTHLASGPITRSGDIVSIELHQPDSMPAVVRIVWPTAPTITTPTRYNEVASTAMRLLAEASTMLARLRACKRLNPAQFIGSTVHPRLAIGRGRSACAR